MQILLSGVPRSKEAKGVWEPALGLEVEICGRKTLRAGRSEVQQAATFGKLHCAVNCI